MHQLPKEKRIEVKRYSIIIISKPTLEWCYDVFCAIYKIEFISVTKKAIVLTNLLAASICSIFKK